MSGEPEFSLEAQEPPAFGAEERRGACLETSEAGGELERRWGLELLERGRSPGCGCCREGNRAGEGLLVSMRGRSDEIEATRTH